jgi:hypothetical protein
VDLDVCFGLTALVVLFLWYALLSVVALVGLGDTFF